MSREITITLKLQVQLESVYLNRAHRGAFKAGALARLQGRSTSTNPYLERDDNAQVRGFWSAWMSGYHGADQLAKATLQEVAASPRSAVSSGDRHCMSAQAPSSGRSAR